MLSIILNDTCRPDHPVAKDSLHVIESEVIPHRCSCFFNFVIRVKPMILQDSLRPAKKSKATGAYVGRKEWVAKLEKMMLLEFRHLFSCVLAD
jgi:hypothetical protein